MKNCLRVLSLVLALTLIMSTVAFASGTTDPKPADYAGVVFYDDFTGDLAQNTYNVGPLTVVTPIADNDENKPDLVGNEGEGDFLKVDIKSGTGSNYFRMRYDGTGYDALDKFGYPLNDLHKMQASFDICPTTDNVKFTVKFYDKFTNSTQTIAQNLITFGNNGKISFTNSTATVDYEANKWLSFDVYFNFTGVNDGTSTYDVYIDGQRVVQGATTGSGNANLYSCVESFGSDTINNSTTDFSYYLDNFRLAVDTSKPEDLAGEIFFEDYNGDENVNSGDYNHSGVAYNIVNKENATGLTGSEDKGDFVKVDFTGGTQGYFRIEYTGSNSALDKSGYNVDGLKNMQASFDICPTTNNVQFTVKFYDRFQVESTIAENLITFKNNGKISFTGSSATVDYEANKWLSFDLYFNFSGVNDGTSTYDVYINGERVVNDAKTSALYSCVESFGSDAPTFTSDFTFYWDNLRLAALPKAAMVSSNPANGATNINPSQDITATFDCDIADSFNASMATLVDANLTEVPFTATASGKTVTINPTNILEFNTQYTLTLKGNISFAENMILGGDKKVVFTTTNVDLHEGYTEVIADIDFEEVEGDSIVAKDDADTDSTGKYYVRQKKTVSISEATQMDGTTGKVASLAGSTAAYGFIGIAKNYTNEQNAYTHTGNAPGLIKLEVEMNKTAGAFYIFVGDNTTAAKDELVMWGGDGDLYLRDNNGRPQLSTKKYTGWHKFTVYIDFDNNVYYFYFDDVYMAKKVLPSVAVNTGQFVIGTNATGTGFVDNMSVSTIPAYGANTVSRFTNAYGETKLGYAYKNAGEEATNAMLLIADYEGRKTMTQAIAEQTSIPAGKTGLVTVNNIVDKADGITRKVYLWNGFETLVPLITPFEI